MAAQLRFFVIVLIILIGVFGLGSWYLGPNLLHLAFFAEGRDEPYLTLDFRDDVVGYDMLKTSSEEDWQATFSGDWHLSSILEGRVEDEWAVLTLSTYAEAGDVVQFVTTNAYRELMDQNPDFDHHVLGSFTEL